jgi:hypothetical protein
MRGARGDGGKRGRSASTPVGASLSHHTASSSACGLARARAARRAANSDCSSAGSVGFSESKLSSKGFIVEFVTDPFERLVRPVV